MTHASVSSTSRDELALDTGRTQAGVFAAIWALGLTYGADAIGVLLLTGADARSRVAGSGAHLLFWAGLVTILLPTAGVLTLSRQSREVRLAIALGFGCALYIAKVVYEPTIFTFHDEFAHYRNAINLLTSGRLFGYNPLISATAYYPGLAAATDTLVRITGLPIYTCGLILIGCARLTITGILFLLADKLLGSPRAAGVAVLAYASNPNFLYWDVQYAYESLALPLALLAIFLLVRRNGLSPSRLAITASLLVAATVVVTHHVTAWTLTAFLAVWALGAWLFRRWRFSSEYMPVVPATVTASVTVLWLTAVAPVTVDYLGPVLSRAVVQAARLVTARQTSRTLFVNTGQAVAAPFWQDAAAIAATIIILAVLPQALDRMRRAHLPLVAKVLAASSLLWTVLLPLRFTAQGQEAANRSSEFVYIGVALCVAFLLELFLDSSRWQRIMALGTVVVLFIGGVSVSWNYAQLLAPDYRLANGSSVVTPSDQALATWMLASLGPGHRIATDTQTALALGSTGRQDVLSSAENNAQIWQIFYPRTVNTAVVAELRRSRVQYVVVQLDLVDAPIGVPRFDDSEPAQDYNAPLYTVSLRKFSESPLFTEIYSSGSLHVYQVSSSLPGEQP